MYCEKHKTKYMAEFGETCEQCDLEKSPRKSYWQIRCELAEAFIESHVSDPDITNEMCEAYGKWLEFKGDD